MKYFFLKYSNSQINTSKKLIVLVCCLLCLGSCRKFIEITGPATSSNADFVFTDDATATAVMTGVYAKMINVTFFAGNRVSATALSVYPEFSADNLRMLSETAANISAYYKNQLTPSSSHGGLTFWSNFYPLIYTCNAVLEGVAKSSSLSPHVARQLSGEAYFTRAFLHFYLVNLYGKVPLAISTDYQQNEGRARDSVSTVYGQISADLKSAIDLLSDHYLGADLKSSTTERVRPNKYAAMALLSRVYLYTEDYVKAEQEATNVLNNTSLYDTVSVNEAFLKNRKETIWSLQPVISGANTPEADFYTSPAAGPSATRPAYLAPGLMNSFQEGDIRRTNWTRNRTATSGIVYPYAAKYKVNTLNAPVTEYSVVLRVGEQYLIRAEARAQQDKISAAQSDLNIIRKRAGLPNTLADSRLKLLDSILLERRVELFAEWGHRWFDLKRTGRIDEMMNIAAPLKGTTWKPEWQLYPIPQQEREKNANLTQNDGYPQ